MVRDSIEKSFQPTQYVPFALGRMSSRRRVGGKGARAVALVRRNEAAAALATRSRLRQQRGGCAEGQPPPACQPSPASRCV
eukprot:COSAG02_NODE_1420_length_12692_cov_3.543397_7_plen_81_part_00